MLNFTELGKLSSQNLEFYMKASFSVLGFMQKAYLHLHDWDLVPPAT